MATDLNKTIAATVKALSRGKGFRTIDLQEAIGGSTGKISSRLNGSIPWTAEEVDTLARLLDVDVNELLTGLKGTFAVRS